MAEPQAWPMLQRKRCQHDDLKHLLVDWVRLIWFSFRGIDIRPEPKCAYLTPLQLLHGTLDTAKSLFPRERICTDLEFDCESGQSGLCCSGSHRKCCLPLLEGVVRRFQVRHRFPRRHLDTTVHRPSQPVSSRSVDGGSVHYPSSASVSRR